MLQQPQRKGTPSLPRVPSKATEWNVTGLVSVTCPSLNQSMYQGNVHAQTGQAWGTHAQPWSWRWKQPQSNHVDWELEESTSPQENQGAMPKKEKLITRETKATVSHPSCRCSPTFPVSSIISQILCQCPRETAKALQCRMISLSTDCKATLTKMQEVMNSRRVMVESCLNQTQGCWQRRICQS